MAEVPKIYNLRPPLKRFMNFTPSSTHINLNKEI
jgi:hypothetical protein